ncbi:MAG: hypothetical protein GY796_25075, partial [Chloroflexi bacterium]|nr:hypothetical protein [Chloroflexota bacterium]
AVAEADSRATAQAQAEASEGVAIAQRATAVAEADFRATAEAVAVAEREAAVTQAQLAQSRELAAAATNNLDVDPELSLLLARQALSTAQTTEAANAVHTAILASRVRMTLPVQAYVWDVAITRDGNFIATVADDKTVRIWDATTDQELFQVQVPVVGYYPQMVQFNLNGDQVATVNLAEGMTLTIREIPSGDERSTTIIHADNENISAYALSPDWTQIAIGYEDGAAGIWDASTGQQLFNLPGHTDQVGVTYSQDGQRLLTVSRDNTIQVWNTLTGEAIQVLTLNHEGQISLQGEPYGLSPDGNLLALATAGNSDGPRILVWDLEAADLTPDSPPLTTISGGHDNVISGLAVSPDGKQIATVARDETARVWDPLTGQAILTLNHGSNVWSVAFNNDGSQLLTGDWMGSARMWNITPEGEAEVFTFSAPEGRSAVKDIHPDGRQVVTAGGGVIYVLDLTTGEVLLELDDHIDQFVRNVEYSRDGKLLAAASTGGTVVIWDAESGERLVTLEGHEEGLVGGYFTGVLDAAFSPDGRQVVTAGTDKTARIWDVATGEELQVLTGHTAGLTNVAYSPDGKLIATASDEPDVTVKIWNAETGQELFALPPSHGDRVWGLDFSPDGTLLATAGGDTTAKVWYLDMAAGRGILLSTLTGHTGTTQVVHFNPDGNSLTSNGGGKVKVWDLSPLLNIDLNTVTETISLPELLSFSGYSYDINPSNNTLAMSSGEGTVRIYTLSLEELMKLAADRQTRPLTAAECQQYLHMETCP